ncbi:hypothetical protein Tco_0247882 [Tanacetum coccineum]
MHQAATMQTKQRKMHGIISPPPFTSKKSNHREEFQETESIEYTRTEIQQFRDTLIQHMESVKKSIDERAQHKRENNRRVNDRVMQSKEGKVDSSTALDAGLVVMESNETESERHVSSSRSGKDTHAEDADINSVNDKQPLAEVQLTVQHDTLANEQQHSVQSEPIYDTHLLEKVDRNTIPDSTNMCHRGGEIEQNAEKCQVSCPLLDLSFDNMTTEFSNQSFESKNIFLKKTVAQLQKDFSRMEAHCVNMELKYQNQALKDGQHGQILNETSNKAKINKEIKVLEKINIELEHSVAKLLADNENKTVENADLKAQIQEKVFANVALKNELRKLKGNSVDTKFAKPSILGKPVLQPPRNQSVVRQPNAFKSKRPNFSKPRFASQVDVNNVLSKPVTQHYLPKGRESAFAKSNHMIASSSSRNSSKNMPRFSSNDMVHKYYLEEAKKKTQERDRKVLPTSKSSCPTTTVMPKADHSRNSSPFSDFKHFVCSTCQKCVFNANHDACITKFLKEVNSRAKIQPNKTRNSNKPVDPTSHTQKPGRKIVTGHSFSPNKSSAVHEKTNTPRSYLRWIPTGRIFNTAGLKWVPTGKTFTSSTTKVDCELPNGSNDYITNPYKCDQTLNVSAGTLNLSADQHPCFMIMASVDNTSGPVPQRKERCTLQCALSSKEEKSSCFADFEGKAKKTSYERLGGRPTSATKNHMSLSYDDLIIQLEPEGSTQGYLLVSVEVLSHEVSVSAEGVKELKRKVKIKGEKKEALLTLRQKPEHQSDTQVITVKMEILLEPTSNKLMVDPHRYEGYSNQTWANDKAIFVP